MRNEGWAMFGSYESVISPAGEVSLKINGKLKAPSKLSDKESH